MCRVGIEKTASVGAQHFDGFLRRHRPHGEGLRARLHVFHDWVAFVVFQGLAIRTIFRLLVAGDFQRRHILVRIKILDHALPSQ